MSEGGQFKKSFIEHFDQIKRRTKSTLRNPVGGGMKTFICFSDGRDANIGTTRSLRLLSGNFGRRSWMSLSIDSISSWPVKNTSTSPSSSSRWIWKVKKNYLKLCQ